MLNPQRTAFDPAPATEHTLAVGEQLEISAGLFVTVVAIEEEEVFLRIDEPGKTLRSAQPSPN